jgi:hypothetical protein
MLSLKNTMSDIQLVLCLNRLIRYLLGKPIGFFRNSKSVSQVINLMVNL